MKKILAITATLLTVFSLVLPNEVRAQGEDLVYASPIQWVPNVTLSDGVTRYYGITHGFRDALNRAPEGWALVRQVFGLEGEGSFTKQEEYFHAAQAWGAIRGISDVEAAIASETAELWTKPYVMGYQVIVGQMPKRPEVVSTALVKHYRPGATSIDSDNPIVASDTIWADGIFVPAASSFGAEQNNQPGYLLYFQAKHAATGESGYRLPPVDSMFTKDGVEVIVKRDSSGHTTNIYNTYKTEPGMCGKLIQMIYCRQDSARLIARQEFVYGDCELVVTNEQWIDCDQVGLSGEKTSTDTLYDTVYVRNRAYLNIARSLNIGQLDLNGFRLTMGVETSQQRRVRFNISGYGEYVFQLPEKDEAERPDLYPDGFFRGAEAIFGGFRSGVRYYPVARSNVEVGVGIFAEGRVLLDAGEIEHERSSDYNAFRINKTSAAGGGLELVANVGKHLQFYGSVGTTERINLFGPKQTLYTASGESVEVIGDAFPDNGDTGGETADLNFIDRLVYGTRTWTMGITYRF